MKEEDNLEVVWNGAMLKKNGTTKGELLGNYETTSCILLTPIVLPTAVRDKLGRKGFKKDDGEQS